MRRMSRTQEAGQAGLPFYYEDIIRGQKSLASSKSRSPSTGRISDDPSLDRAYLAFLCLAFTGFAVSAYRLPWPGSLPPIVFALIPFYHALLHLFPAFRAFLQLDDELDSPLHMDADAEFDIYAFDPKPSNVPIPLSLGGTSSRTQEVYVFPEPAPIGTVIGEVVAGARRRSIDKGRGEMWVIVEDWDKL